MKTNDPIESWLFDVRKAPLFAAYGPKSRSRVAMDMYHRSIAIHFAGGASESFTPFARIVNSYDTSRAVRLEVGFIRAICSNGMIIHEATNQITAAHTVEDIRALKEKRPFDGMKSLTRQFEETLSDFRAVPVTPEEGMEITRRVMDWPILPDKPAARTIADQAELDAELAKRNKSQCLQAGEDGGDLPGARPPKPIPIALAGAGGVFDRVASISNERSQPSRRFQSPIRSCASRRLINR